MMNELITRHLMSDTGPEEEAALLEWRRADPANEAHYRRRTRMWELLGKARGPARSSRPAPLADEIVAQSGIHRLPTRGEAVAGGAERAPWKGPARSRVAAVAVLVAASLAAVVPFLSRPDRGATLGVVEFITGPHENNTLRLDDGTVVHLAPGSKLTLDNRSPRVRQVSFEGVGYFAVARDEMRPFVIRTRGGDAVVLGTRFELRTREREMRVVVVEGRVALESDGARKEVSTSQMGHAGADQAPTVVDVEGVGDLLSWVEGLLVFQATPLSQVVQELSRHYSVKIEIHDSELARREVTAWLQEQSFDTALTAICGAVGASCTIRPDGAIMRLPARVGRMAELSSGGTRK